MMPHGTVSRYADSKCRCLPCREASTEKQRVNAAIRRARPKDPNDPRHGSDSFYTNHGCRCEPCVLAHSEKCADEYQNRKLRGTK